jgi:hypothetical protein
MNKIDIHLVNAYIKIKNPLILRPNSVNYEFEPDDFEFKSQQKKYDLLKASLEPYNIMLTKVYATRWASANNNGKLNRYAFVVETNSHIVWYKYEAESYCSSKSYIFFGKKKMLLNEWLNGTQEFRNQIINEMIQHK